MVWGPRDNRRKVTMIMAPKFPVGIDWQNKWFTVTLFIIAFQLLLGMIGMHLCACPLPRLQVLLMRTVMLQNRCSSHIGHLTSHPLCVGSLLLMAGLVHVWGTAVTPCGPGKELTNITISFLHCCLFQSWIEFFHSLTSNCLVFSSSRSVLDQALSFLGESSEVRNKDLW